MFVNPDEGGFFPLIWFVSCEKNFDEKGVDELCELDGKESKEACGYPVGRDGVGGPGGVKGVDKLSEGRKVSKKGSRITVFGN